MNIQTVQFNTKLSASFKDRNDTKKPYLNAEGAVITNNNVKPLPPKGHLVHDTVISAPKYFIKDIGYDIKSVKNGLNGSANDHQLGRLNDIGLRLGGIAIAIYLASRTSNPKTRLMEYFGLGTFLAVMDLYPKLFINLPAKIVHGYDIDKQYIDDQGRKKSVFQDSNYIPYDMYQGEVNDEDIDKIGDKMGIPRDIDNRNDVIKEQMRKIATQNNTLWMMTAGFATPILTALTCCGLEKVAGNIIEKIRNNHSDKVLKDVLNDLDSTSANVEQLKANNLSTKIEQLLTKYEGKTIPEADLEMITNTLTESLDSSVAKCVKNDILNICNSEKTVVIVNKSIIPEIVSNIQKTSSMRVAAKIMPSSSEIEEILKNIIGDIDVSKETELSEENILKFKNALSDNIDTKINTFKNLSSERREALVNIKTQILKNALPVKHKSIIDKDAIGKIVNFTKALDAFQHNETILNKCSMIKFEANSESIMARSYLKFANVLMKELNFSQKELKCMRNSTEYTNQILDKKLSELVKDEEKYNKVVTKISKIISEMEEKLHGTQPSGSAIADLIYGTEKNYNLFAERLDKIGGFKNTAIILAGKDRSSILDIQSDKLRENVEKFMDGLSQKAVENGSAKKRAIDRIINDRYAGTKNSLNRMIHSLDVYKRAEENAAGFTNNPFGNFTKEKIEEIIKISKSTVLNATSSDYTLKFDIASIDLYGDMMRSLYKSEGNEADILGKGVVSEGTKNAMQKNERILERFQQYIQRVRNVIGNNATDFTKPYHILNENAGKAYSQSSRTQSAMFNLLGQTPVDFIKSAADRKYTSQKWLKIMGIIAGSVATVTLLVQFTFGKINNPQTLKRNKEINNEIK